MQFRSFLYALAGAVWLLPAVAAAAGLVPCVGAADCNICTFGQLIQNIINFAIGVSIPLSACLFAWAGWLYFTNRENEHQVEQAHAIFRSVFIGFCIAVAGWLIVQTVLKILAPGYQGWTTFNCTGINRPMNESVTTLLQQAGLKGLNTQPNFGIMTDSNVNTSGANAGCQIGDYKNDQGMCINMGGEYYPPSKNGGYYSYLNTAGTQQYADQLASICQGYQDSFSDCAKTSQAIMAIESGGNCNAISPSGAVGCMQVMPATACGMDKTINGCSTGDYSAVRQALLDPQLNMQIGVQYLNQMRGQFADDSQFIAAYNGGPKANTDSVTCPGQTYWQCSANSGYAETRNYVAKFQSAYSKL